jgi:hypothetical protein
LLDHIYSPTRREHRLATLEISVFGFQRPSRV